MTYSKLFPVIAAALLAAPLQAAEPLSASEFEAYVEGRTLYYGQSGQAYGVEEYLPNRRVRWSFLDGKCKEGEWFATPESQICFVYEDNPDPQCWSFFEDGGKLRAVFENDPQATVLYEAQQDDEPMLCYGPDVGV